MVFAENTEILIEEGAVMKSEITLTSRELLFISALLNATEFLGIPDAFFGMEESEMQQELLDLQSTLERKGYAEMDFDGSFTLKDEIREMVNNCANCDAFIVVDKNKVGEMKIRELYYEKYGCIVKLSEDEERYILTFVADKGCLIEQIKGGVEFKHSGASNLISVTITDETLSDVKTTVGESPSSDSIKLLMEQGCDELSAKTIIDGITGHSDYYSVIVTNLDGKNEGVYSVILISSEIGIYRLIPISNEEREEVQFNALTSEEAMIILNDTIHHAFPSESEVVE